MTDDELVSRLPEPWRGLRMYSSSALAELTPDDLLDWAGACRQAIRQFEALAAEKARLEGDLNALAQAEATYRYAHDILGTGDPKTGRAWDLMKRAGDKARSALAPSGISEGEG